MFYKRKLKMKKDLNKINRLEVIDGHGRRYVNYKVENLELSFQDDDRTLKVFLNSETKKELNEFELLKNWFDNFDAVYSVSEEGMKIENDVPFQFFKGDKGEKRILLFNVKSF